MEIREQFENLSRKKLPGYVLRLMLYKACLEKLIADRKEKIREKTLILTEDGRIAVQAFLKDGGIWLSQQRMAELFGRDRAVISRHIRKLFAEQELDEAANTKKIRPSGSERAITAYSLDVVLAVGCRVKSERGREFRRWAAGTLKKYILEEMPEPS